jgi:hypothetical protein
VVITVGLVLETPGGFFSRVKSEMRQPPPCGGFGRVPQPVSSQNGSSLVSVTSMISRKLPICGE